MEIKRGGGGYVKLMIRKEEKLDFIQLENSKVPNYFQRF